MSVQPECFRDARSMSFVRRHALKVCGGNFQTLIAKQKLQDAVRELTANVCQQVGVARLIDLMH